jgi:DNA polymerase-3 subunit epsilon
MFAIVDIETTGSHPDQAGITEIAIILHDGRQVEQSYETLINPGFVIPPYIVHLTGITNEMVAMAPGFEEKAGYLFDLLEQRVFVAHNVNFDFSFIKYYFQRFGYYWQPKKLCTLRLSKKVFPGLPKYGLGSLCRHFNFENPARHRAGGDALVTARLFERILQSGGENIIKEALKKSSHDQLLPPHLPSGQVKALPMKPGVYYFRDGKDNVIYVGKAKNIRQRVLSHFTGLQTGRKRQGFLREIFSVSFKECPTELTSLLLESIEIKRLWPKYNKSQKHFVNMYGIYTYEDARGLIRLGIDRKRKNGRPVVTYRLLTDAYRNMWRIVRQYELIPALCFLEKDTNNDITSVEPIVYNKRVQDAIQGLQYHAGTYIILEKLSSGNCYCCILVEKGVFYGFGLVPHSCALTELDEIKKFLTVYPQNEVILSMLENHRLKFQNQVIDLQLEPGITT